MVRRSASAQNTVALVTGGNKGIGKAIAGGLARKGMTVLIGSRDADRGRAAAAELSTAGEVIVQVLDVVDQRSIDAAAQEIEARFGKLDVLVNNAGTGGTPPDRKPSEATAADFREVYETNVFGVVAVTNAMLPLLRRAPAARIVNMSSLRGSIGSSPAFAEAPFMPYSTSKTALNAITAHYANELAATAIKVNACAPGQVPTDLNGHRGTRTPEQAAVIVIRLATLGADGPTGGFFNDAGPLPW